MTSASEPVPRNLGHGLYELACRQEAAKHPAAARLTTGYLDHTAAVDATHGMQFDQGGRVLVDLVLDGSLGLEPMRAALDKAADGNLQVLATDKDYRSGIVEAYVPAEKLADLARTSGVMSVHACLKPLNCAGKVTTQGVVQHRVKAITGKYDGTGITVGVLSDSYGQRNNDL